MDDLEAKDLHVLAAFLLKTTSVPRVHFWAKNSQIVSAETDMSYGKQDPMSPRSPAASKWDRIQKLKAGQTARAGVLLAQNVTETSKLAKGLETHLRVSTQLIELKIVGLKFSTEAWRCLSRGIAGATGLHYIGLITCELTDGYLAELSTGLMSVKGLRKLDLSRNLLGKSSGFDVSRVISQHGERRDEVLWAHGLRNETSQAAVSEGLEQLSLAFNQLPDQAIDEISRVLHSDVWLKVLDLRQNEITEEGMYILAEMLRSNKSLLFVDARTNQCPDDLDAHRLIYNRLRRNVIRYRKKYRSDDNQWEKRLLELAATIDPEAVRKSPVAETVETADFNFVQEFKATMEQEPDPRTEEKPRESPPITERMYEEAGTCSSCRSMELKLFSAENTISELQADNAQLRKQIQIMRVQHFSSGSISQHTLTAGESMSVTGASQKPVQGGTGEELDSGTLLKIEQMMSELTRLMDALETSGQRTGNST